MMISSTSEENPSVQNEVTSERSSIKKMKIRYGINNNTFFKSSFRARSVGMKIFGLGR